MTRPRVYLAGPIAGLAYDEGRAWRRVAHAALEPDVEVLDPMRYDFYSGTEADVSVHRDTNVLMTPTGITTRDLSDLRRSDVVLMNLHRATRASLGTMIEVGFLRALDRPLVLVLTPDDLHWHPMVLGIAGFVVPDLDEALRVTRQLLNLPPDRART